MRTLANTVLGMLIGATTVVVGGGCTPEVRTVERVPVAAPGGPPESRLEYERPKPMPERPGAFDRELPPAERR